MNETQPNSFPMAILGAGLGSRLKSESHAKPLAKLGNSTLLQRWVDLLVQSSNGSITCALREELMKDQDFERLPKAPQLQYIFVNTPSSLHTLVELIRKLEKPHVPTLFLMADTILRDSDLHAFLQFCQSLPTQTCAVLTTTYVDDEKPLWVHKSPEGLVKDFGSNQILEKAQSPTLGAPEPAQEITSGMYWLSPKAMEIAEEVLAEGTDKMRNFLQRLAKSGQPIKTFVVAKTIDVDHPLDLKKAADFLQNE